MAKPKLTFWVRTRQRLISVTASKGFYIALIIGFVFSAVWVAMTSIYPSAFDEEAHLGVIKFFTAHPNPFLAWQPHSIDYLGNVVHDPSYLYRYLMVPPWWLITHLTSSFYSQIIFMRLINIALFTLGIVLLRKFLLRITPSKSLVNLSIALLVLTPMSIQLAAQINYDNLIFPLLAAVFLFGLNFTVGAKSGRPKIVILVSFISLGLLACLVKYTYLPIFISILIYLIWALKLYKPGKLKKLHLQMKPDWLVLSFFKKIALVLFVVVSFGLFFERYGLNTWRYHTPLPDCVKVIGAPRCEAYSIYRRTIIYANTKPAVINKNPIRFTYLWLKHMLYNLMMSINGPVSGYSIGIPLPFPYAAAIIFSVTGLFLSMFYWRQVFASTAMRMAGLSALVYMVLLWLLNYSSYLQTGRRVAIQGRYLMPFLLIIYTAFLIAFSELFKKLPNLKIIFASLLISFFLLGGGVMTFIMHSDKSWYWQNNKAAFSLNENTRNTLDLVIPGAHQKGPYWQNSFSF